ncbi:MAG: hypothetical protein JWL62_1586 [Hyphomicrobiales bacterium]|nr:hypothetical protein [Hyphomicrobiales bacterium]
MLRRSLIACLLSATLPAIAAPASDPARSAALSDVLFVDAITWGVNGSTMTAFQSMGREKWLQSQLHPRSTILPGAVQKQLDAMPVTQRSVLDLSMDFDTQARANGQITDPDQKEAARKVVQNAMNEILRQATAASILRSLYSPDQLQERMTWFWFNHFNVHPSKANNRLLIWDYETKTIRAHALGRFRDLLGATLRHPAMLRYLDNAENYVGHINENYAREIMELHTMGVGSGYTQKDVEELARILTGVGVDIRRDIPDVKPEQRALILRDGVFTFNPRRHDFGDKIFLGQLIRGSGFSEVEQALDILCKQPATAQRLARQIATYFVADDPPRALVDRLAQRFLQTDGEIANVLDTLFHSLEFNASLGTRFKDPVRFIYSAVRLAYDAKVIVNVAPVQSWLNRLAEGLFNHQTPDGFSMLSSAWNGSGQMVARFEIARQIGSGPAGLFKEGPNAVEQPGFPQLQNALYFSTLQQVLSGQTRESLDKAVSQQDWNTLFLSSPEFMQ